MDAYFSVKIILIGYTGLIGSEIYSQLTNQMHNVIGLNSTTIKLNNDVLLQRTKSLSEDVQEYLENGDVVINAAWVESKRQNRNDTANLSMAKSEIELINTLVKMHIKYISLGSIAEYKIDEITDSWDSNYAEGKRMVSRYLAKSKADYVWVRVASCFGANDTRSWLVNDLKLNKIKKGTVASNPNNILNLTSVKNISKELIQLINANDFGDINLMANQWYKAGEIIEVYFGGKIPTAIFRDRGPFSTSDPIAKITEESFFLDFLINK
jgi:nucleoside-diphosphate-sugar epimerase